MESQNTDQTEERECHEIATLQSRWPFTKQKLIDLQKISRIAMEKIQHLFFHMGICTRLTCSLLHFLICGTSTWIVMTIRLIMFAALLIPGWIGMLRYFLFSPSIVRNVEYGLGAKKRNLLDIYLPNNTINGTNTTLYNILKLSGKSHDTTVPMTTGTTDGNNKHQQKEESNKVPPSPIVIFVTGGAWIIGYKLWGAFIGRGLSSMGILTIIPDYRNFPQGNVEDMMDDIAAAVHWTQIHAGRYGGDTDKIVLAGQSAGAHICMCALVDSLRVRIVETASGITLSSNLPMGIDGKGSDKSGSTDDEDMIISQSNHQLHPSSQRIPHVFSSHGLRQRRGDKVEKSGQPSNIQSIDFNDDDDVEDMIQEQPSSSYLWGRTWQFIRSRWTLWSYGVKSSPCDPVEMAVDEISSRNQTTTTPTPAVHVTEVTYPSTQVKEVSVMHGVAGATVRADRVGLVGRGRVLHHNVPNSSKKSGVDVMKNGQIHANVKESKGMQKGIIVGSDGGVGANGRPPSPEWGNWEDASVSYDETMNSGQGGTINGSGNSNHHSGNNNNGNIGGSSTVMNGSTSRGYRRRLDLSAIKLFIGISGPYNLQALATHLHTRGLDASILSWVCKGDLTKHSPALSMAELLHDINASVVDPSEVTEEESDCKDSSSASSSSSSSSDEGGDKGHDVPLNDVPLNDVPLNDVPLGTDTDRDHGLFSNHQLGEDNNNNQNSMQNVNHDHHHPDLGGHHHHHHHHHERDSTTTPTTTTLLTSSALRPTSPKMTTSSPCNLANLGFPPVALFHGSHDLSVPSDVSAEMAAVLCRGGGDVSLRMYEEWAHTDAILEGPLRGDCTLCNDIIEQIDRIFPAPAPVIARMRIVSLPSTPRSGLAQGSGLGPGAGLAQGTGLVPGIGPRLMGSENMTSSSSLSVVVEGDEDRGDIYTPPISHHPSRPLAGHGSSSGGSDAIVMTPTSSVPVTSLRAGSPFTSAVTVTLCPHCAMSFLDHAASSSSALVPSLSSPSSSTTMFPTNNTRGMGIFHTPPASPRRLSPQTSPQMSGHFLNLGTTTPPQQSSKNGSISSRPVCDCGLSLRATSAPILVGHIQSLPSTSNHGHGGNVVGGGGGMNGGGGGIAGGSINGLNPGSAFHAHCSPSRSPIRSLSRQAIQQHLAASAAAAANAAANVNAADGNDGMTNTHPPSSNASALMDTSHHHHAHQWSHQLFPPQPIKSSSTSSSTMPSYIYRWERKQTDTLDDCRVPSALVALARYVNPF